MKVSINVDGKDFAIGGEALARFVGSQTYGDAYGALFSALARYPSSAVREMIAEKDAIDADTAQLLIDDCSIGVLENIVSNRVARDLITQERLLQLIRLGSSRLTKNVLSGLSDFTLVDAEAIVKEMLAMNDADLTVAIADSNTVPKRIHQKLAKSTDPDVASRAKQRLR